MSAPCKFCGKDTNTLVETKTDTFPACTDCREEVADYLGKEVFFVPVDPQS